jgi:hypothetical protein
MTQEDIGMYYENNNKYPKFNYLWAHDYDWFECYDIEMLVLSKEKV